MTGVKEALAVCEVLKKAAPASLAALAACARLKRLARGEHLFWDRQAVDSAHFVIEGRLSLYKLNDRGEKKAVFLLGPGHLLNEALEPGLAASINCEAAGPSLVLSFPIKDFLRVMSEDFFLTRAVLEALSVKIRRLYRQMKNSTGSLRGDKKLAAKLWKLARDHGAESPGGVRLNAELTVTYLADLLGARRETVSRQLKVLLDAGLAVWTPGGLVIPDRAALMDYFKSP